MDDMYAQATDESDPVYKELFSKWCWHHSEMHPSSFHASYLGEQLKLLESGRMPIKDYNNFLKKGASTEVILKMYQRDENKTLLQKIQEETPELIEELLKDLKEEKH
jgi:hypothetical protein